VPSQLGWAMQGRGEFSLLIAAEALSDGIIDTTTASAVRAPSLGTCGSFACVSPQVTHSRVPWPQAVLAVLVASFVAPFGFRHYLQVNPSQDVDVDVRMGADAPLPQSGDGSPPHQVLGAGVDAPSLGVELTVDGCMGGDATHPSVNGQSVGGVDDSRSRSSSGAPEGVVIRTSMQEEGEGGVGNAAAQEPGAREHLQGGEGAARACEVVSSS